MQTYELYDEISALADQIRAWEHTGNTNGVTLRQMLIQIRQDLDQIVDHLPANCRGPEHSTKEAY